MQQKTFDHRVHLVGSFELAEVSGADGPTIDYFWQPLRHEMRRI